MIDTHCHLNDEQLKDRVSEAYFEFAKSHGLSKMICVGWDLESSKLAVEMAHKYDCVYAAVGIHPENLENISDETLIEVEKLAHEDKVVAIGEIGLDYHWYKDEKDHENQKIWFIKQIELANKLNLPVSIHARDASQDTYDLLAQHPIKQGFVLHCYSGSPEMMERFEKMGAYFGFDGPVTFKNSITPKECAKACRLDRILLETDSPYMTPMPFRGKTNEPIYTEYIRNTIADLRGMDPLELDRITEENSYELFKF